jgi:LEA14-like dessication related protein
MGDIEKQGVSDTTVNALHGGDIDVKLNIEASSAASKPSSVTYSNYLCYYYAGLSSDDPALKSRSQYIIYGHVVGFTLVTIGIILTFTVIIPAIMQNIVNQSNLNLITAGIANPSNASFTSTVLGKFTNAGSTTAKVKMNTLTVSWAGPGGGDMLKLSHSNSLTVENNHEATMTSLATVYDMEAFSNFNTYLIHHDSAQWTIDGTAEVSFIVTSTVNFHKEVTLQGANNFSIPPQVLNTNITNGTATELLIASDVIMTSQSNVNLDLGQTLYFNLILNGVKIGVGHINNYQMVEGPYQTVAHLDLTFSNNEEYTQICYLMGNYSCGYDMNATMQGFYLSPPLTWLTPALASMTMETTLPGCKDELVRTIYLYDNQVVPTTLPYTMVLYNPQPVPMIITAITGNIYSSGYLIATVNNQDLYIIVPPHGTNTTMQLPSKSVVSGPGLQVFKNLVKNGGGLVDLDSHIIGNFSEFKASITYKQANVTLIVIT